MIETAPQTLSFATARQAMVDSQLRTNSVNDPRVVDAMANVPREQFLPAHLRNVAYRDRPLPLGAGRMHNDPLATGRLLVAAEIAPADRVLLIGAAGGYAAALLARLAAHVVAVEESADLAATARTALAGIGNVELVEGPLNQGWAAGAPYDVIVIDGAVERLPDGFVEQCRPDGRIVTGIVDRGVTRLARGQRSQGGFGMVDFADVECVVLPGFERPRGFTF